ncbi:hypothetical protein RIF29_36027 [Crotalaria pallida]|uniref:Uncharacterized protein n=1 Tax=Crotalaria pallida TaxID=3830 RepID=A0AAN9EG96_CROPI
MPCVVGINHRLKIEVYSLLKFRMTTLNFVNIILALALALASIAAVEARLLLQDNNQIIVGNSDAAIKVFVHVGLLPQGESKVNIVCYLENGQAGFDTQISPGGDTNFNVPDSSTNYKCDGLWDSKTASFLAYDKIRDQGYNNVYWKLDSDGFFQSHDQQNWTKFSGWQ